MEPLGDWQGGLPAWHGDRPTIVVLPFAAHDEDSYQAVYARRLAEWLANRLHTTGVVDAAFPLLRGDDGGQADYAMLTRLPEPVQVRDLCARVRADWAVYGRFNLLDRFEWEIALLDVATGEVVFADQTERESERLLEAVTVVALQILRSIGLPPLDDDARSRLFDHGTRSLDAVRAYFLAADLLGSPARGARETEDGLAYAFRSLELDPDFHSPADLVIGEALAGLESGEEEAARALGLVERLAHVASGYHKVPAAVGAIWQRGGDHVQAAAAYREALRLSPDHPYYLYRLGVSLHQLDDPDALPTLEAAVATDPDNVAARDLLAVRLANAERLGEAMAIWTEQLERQPAHAPALTNLGAAYENLGDRERARQHYEAATRARRDYAPAYDRLADLLARQGEHARAFDTLERLSRLRPDDPAVLERLALSLAHLNRPEQELATLNQLARLRPDYWPAAYYRAISLRRLGRQEEAVAAYREVLARQPDHVPSLVDLGVLLGGRRELTEAARLLGRARQLRPDDIGAVYNYAVVQMERGAWDEAERALDQVRALDPADPMPDRVAAELSRRRARGH